MASTQFPGATGPFGPERFPLYGVVQDGKRFRVTVEVRERSAASTRIAVPQIALPEVYRGQRAADAEMQRLNMSVYHGVMEPHLLAKYGDEVSRG